MFPALRRTVSRVKPPPTGALNAPNGVLTARRLTSYSPTPSARPRPVKPRLGTLAVTGALGTSAYFYLHQPISLDSPDASSSSTNNASRTDRHEEPLSSLIRTYIVYSMCSIPWLVDYSPKILAALNSIPGVKQATEAVVRRTFFAQFVGGESAQETIPVLERLRAQNMGAMLNFSAEVGETEASSSDSNDGTAGPKRAVNKEIVDEIIRCIDVAGEFEDARLAKAKMGRRKEEKEEMEMEGRKTWVAIKLTALIPNPQTFINFSKFLISSRPSPSPSSSSPIPFPGTPHPTDLSVLSPSLDPADLPPTCPLTREDIESLRALNEELRRVCRRAGERGVAVCFDAEHSWYQPAIEAFQLSLMREFNRLDSSSSSSRSSTQPLVYGTFQAYLRRAPEHLARSLRDAEEGGYALGVKLVRGAYHPLELSSHIQTQSRTRTRTRSGGPILEGHETALSISPDPYPPVWEKKEETDAYFDECVRMLVRRVAQDVKKKKMMMMKDDTTRTRVTPSIGLIFGTHNPRSCQLVLDTLISEGLARRVLLPLQTAQPPPPPKPTTNHEKRGAGTGTGAGAEENERIAISREAARRVAVGQLYGMCDILSSSLASRTSVSFSFSSHRNGDQDVEPESEPFVIKYIPYGPLEKVMPYLGRRAIENRSVLSGAGKGDAGNCGGGGGSAKEEKERAKREIRRRVKRFLGFA